MAAGVVLGSKWSTKANLSLTEATLEAYDKTIIPGGDSLNNTMGHFCHFAMLADTNDNYTEPFDWPIFEDFLVVVNPTGVDTDNATTIDVTVNGSFDGTEYVELAAKTDIIQDSDGNIDGNALVGLYDLDAKGKMDIMRLTITAATPSDSTVLIAIVPVTKRNV